MAQLLRESIDCLCGEAEHLQRRHATSEPESVAAISTSAGSGTGPDIARRFSDGASEGGDTKRTIDPKQYTTGRGESR
jgi:hypothetical protein